MNVIVQFLRRDGRRLKHVQDGTPGELRMSTVLSPATYSVVDLVQAVSAGEVRSSAPTVLARLYEPTLATVGHGRMLLRGFEIVNDRSVVQEWSCIPLAQQ